MRVSVLAAVLSLVCAAAEQAPLQVAKRKELKGRFLHITDIHPDPYYVAGGTFESACHKREGKLTSRGREKRRLSDPDAEEFDDDSEEDALLGAAKKKSTRKGGAGKWGDVLSDCDSPNELVDLVFDWLKKEWADEIDFIIWTGDSARHDSDRTIPRTSNEIFDSNRLMVKKMVETFGKKFPIVPTLGNNDIWPHNIMMPGPNKITEQFLRIWKPFIPEDERHVFERGAHFTREVIPDRLAVISLNTLFWFTSNSAVDGCKSHSNDPGALQMDWLEVQLSSFRERGMQVYLIGHVPPHEGLYYDNCYLRYGDLALRYQDTIVGHLFGHQNVDHFFFLNVEDLNSKTSAKSKSRNSRMHFNVVDDAVVDQHNVSDFTFFGPDLPEGRPHLLHSGRFKVLKQDGDNMDILSDKGDGLKKGLLDSFEKLADPELFKHKDYVVMNVGPSVIPAYIPSARIYSYNISGVELDDENASAKVAKQALLRQDSVEDGDDYYDESADVDSDALKKKDCNKPENEDKPRCTFKRKPRYSSPDSPSRSNKPLTPLGFTQFFLPDLDQKKAPQFKVEYTTFKPKQLLPDSLSGQKSTQPPPVPFHLLPGWDSSVGKLSPEQARALDDEPTDEPTPGSPDGSGDSGDANKPKDTPADKFIKEIKRITPFRMKDLTINSYIKLGRNLLSDKKLWSLFTDYMFVSSGGE